MRRRIGQTHYALPSVPIRRPEWGGDESRTAAELTSARDLFDQQLWCFGRDISSPEHGNLLLEFGFDRLPHPHSASIASIYQLRLSEGRSLILRGFGVFWGDDRWGGLFVRRRSFRPQLTPLAKLTHPIWMSDDLPRLTRVTEQELTQASRLLATATCGGIYWLMGLAWTWWAFLPVVVSCWILVRCTRRASQLPTLGWSSAYVTIACLPIVSVSAAIAPAGPSLPAPISPFSPGAYLIMLAVVLIRDATEYVMRRRKTSHA
ncbi:MAG: hypothetical protein U1A77_02890 [Pirellulales bacterium]